MAPLFQHSLLNRRRIAGFMVHGGYGQNAVENILGQNARNGLGGSQAAG